ncbi:VASH2, partial [Symbiodinium sp. KB8]
GKHILEAGLPIQCGQAVFLAAFLTHAHSGLPAHGELPTFQQGLWRLPLRFKSTVLGKDGACHRHIVLAVRLPSGKWGALGISRRAALGAKPFAFAALSDLLWDYALAYRDAGHALIKAYVGLPLPDGLPSHAALNWRGAAVRFPRDWLPPPHMPLHTPTLHRGHWSECAKPILDNFEACAEDLSTIWAARGRLKGSQVAAFRTRHWEAQEYSGQASVPGGAGSSSSDKVSGEAP